jgi:hypothetical protein
MKNTFEIDDKRSVTKNAKWISYIEDGLIKWSIQSKHILSMEYTVSQYLQCTVTFTFSSKRDTYLELHKSCHEKDESIKIELMHLASDLICFIIGEEEKESPQADLLGLSVP